MRIENAQWDGESVMAIAGTVEVSDGHMPSTWWCSKLKGQRVPCLLVQMNTPSEFGRHPPFYIDRDSGILKVSNGGGWRYAHRSIPVTKPYTFQPEVLWYDFLKNTLVSFLGGARDGYQMVLPRDTVRFGDMFRLEFPTYDPASVNTVKRPDFTKPIPRMPVNLTEQVYVFDRVVHEGMARDVARYSLSSPGLAAGTQNQ